MPMNPNFLCCIGAELKNSTQQTTRMSQVYLYRAFEDQTLNDMLSAGFFNAAMGIIRKDDLLLLYSPNEAFAKYTYARVSNVDRDGVEIESIGIDAKDISVDTDGFSVLDGGNLQEIIAQIDSLLPSDVSSLNKLIAESRLQDQISQRAVLKDSNIPQEMQSGLKTPEIEISNALVVDGTAQFEIAPLTDDLTTYQGATPDSLMRKAQIEEVVQEIKTSSLTFIGYVSTTEPDSSVYAFNTGDLWLNSATMPTVFPFAQANIKEWDGTAWVAHSQDYTPANFDFFRNINDSEGYYWFAGQWVVMSTDMSTTYFQLNPISGKWEIKSNVNLPGEPTSDQDATQNNGLVRKGQMDLALDTKADKSATYTKTETDDLLNNKSNTDLSNITATGKETIAHNAMPSNRFVNLTVGASGTSYTAPADGFFRVSCVASGSNQRLNMDCNQTGYQIFSNSSGNELKASCPIRKNDNLYLSYSMPQANVSIRFVYAEGAE